MTYGYNRLRKLLIDKRMTKIEMRKQAGISINILAKNGQGRTCCNGYVSKNLCRT